MVLVGAVLYGILALVAKIIHCLVLVAPKGVTRILAASSRIAVTNVVGAGLSFVEAGRNRRILCPPLLSKCYLSTGRDEFFVSVYRL